MPLENRLLEFAQRAGEVDKDHLSRLTGQYSAIGMESIDDLEPGVYWYVGSPINHIPVIQLPVGWVNVYGDKSYTSPYSEPIRVQTFTSVDGSLAYRMFSSNTWSEWILTNSSTGTAITTTVTGVSNYFHSLSSAAYIGSKNYTFTLIGYVNAAITGPIAFSLPSTVSLTDAFKYEGFLVRVVGGVTARHPISAVYNYSSKTMTLTYLTFENGLAVYKVLDQNSPFGASPGAFTLRLDMRNV